MRNFDLSLSQLKNILLVTMSLVLIFIFFSRPLSMDDLSESLAPLQLKLKDKADVEKSTTFQDDSEEKETSTKASTTLKDDLEEKETTTEASTTEKYVGAEPKLLENILMAKYQPRRGGKSIFFIETKKIEDKVLALSNRQSCSIEAASKIKIQSIPSSGKKSVVSVIANPELDVFLLFSFEVGFFNKTPLPLVDNLLSYKNFHMAYFDIVKYAEKSPLGEWFATGEIYKSKFIINHISDIMRVLTLWK